MRNLAAFTTPNEGYPAYISVNEVENGGVSVRVRQAKVGRWDIPSEACITLSADQWAAFKTQLITGVDPQQPPLI